MALTREQKLLRRAYLGSSDIPAVAGLSRYAGPHDVYLQKVPEQCPLCGGTGMKAAAVCAACDGTGELDVVLDDPEDGTAASDVGSLAEPLLAALYSRRTSRVLRPGSHVVHPQIPWASATPDRVSDDGGPDVELKMVGRWHADDWTEEELPAYYLAQVTWQMFVRGKRTIDVAALIGGTDFRVYHVERDDQLVAALAEAGAQFWRNVQARTPPPMDGSRSASEYLRRRFPMETRDMQAAPLEALGIVTELREVKAQQKAVEQRRAELETQLQALIGDAAGITDDRWGKVTWTTQAGGLSWKSVAEDLRTLWQLEVLQRHDARAEASVEALQQQLDAVFADLLVKHRGPNIRVLRESTKPWTPPKATKAKKDRR